MTRAYLSLVMGALTLAKVRVQSVRVVPAQKLGLAVGRLQIVMFVGHLTGFVSEPKRPWNHKTQHPGVGRGAFVNGGGGGTLTQG